MKFAKASESFAIVKPDSTRSGTAGPQPRLSGTTEQTVQTRTAREKLTEDLLAWWNNSILLNGAAAAQQEFRRYSSANWCSPSSPSVEWVVRLP